MKKAGRVNMERLGIAKHIKKDMKPKKIQDSIYFTPKAIHFLHI